MQQVCFIPAAGCVCVCVCVCVCPCVCVCGADGGSAFCFRLLLKWLNLSTLTTFQWVWETGCVGVCVWVWADRQVDSGVTVDTCTLRTPVWYAKQQAHLGKTSPRPPVQQISCLLPCFWHDMTSLHFGFFTSLHLYFDSISLQFPSFPSFGLEITLLRLTSALFFTSLHSSLT